MDRLSGTVAHLGISNPISGGFDSHIPRQTPGERTREFIEEVARKHYVDVEDVLTGKKRNVHITSARWEIIDHYLKKGFSTTRIGRILNISHTTVVRARQQMRLGRTPYRRYVKES